ncbi:hypothetical protein ABZ883_14660 [Streptomyces sp. NPDC046977]|uniref:hypothetical protein n=1 Tax=Streptomyces sp. NPDC046977 TaxID=3154703 RepID=UPI0033CDA7B2
MPKLNSFDIPKVKLDAAAAAVEASLTTEQRRGLFENPGTTVYVIAALTSKAYTGHADGEEKDPEVKVRVTECEVAADEEEAAALADAKRAMWRRRRMDGTLDEIGNGMRNGGAVLDAAFAGYPTEAEYRQQEIEKEAARRGDFVR